MCIDGERVSAIMLHCHFLKNPDNIEDRYEVSSSEDQGYHQIVDCGEQGAIQKIRVTDAGDGIVKKVEFSCAKIRI